MKLAMLLTQDRGGPTDVCVPLAAELLGRGVDVRVFGPPPARGGADLAGHWSDVRVEVKGDAGAARRLRDAVRAWGPDLVHSQDRRSGLVAMPLRGVPRVHTYHGVPEDVSQLWFDGAAGAETPSRYTRATLTADAVLARLLDVTVVPSLSMGRFLRTRLRVPARKLAHIDNGLPLPAPATPVRAPVRRLLFVGLLVERKGVLDLLDALARPGVLPADGHLTIAGDGPQRATVERAIAAGPLTGRVTMLGFRTDVAALMAEADAVVLPSRMEQQPLVAIEAMAAGRPVLATDTGDVARMLDIGDPRTPLVVPGDLDGLADGLRALFAVPDPGRTGALLAARAAELFDVAGSARAHLALYDTVLGQPASAVSGGGRAPR